MDRIYFRIGCKGEREQIKAMKECAPAFLQVRVQRERLRAWPDEMPSEAAAVTCCYLPAVMAVCRMIYHRASFWCALLAWGAPVTGCEVASYRRGLFQGPPPACSGVWEACGQRCLCQRPLTEERVAFVHHGDRRWGPRSRERGYYFSVGFLLSKRSIGKFSSLWNSSAGQCSPFRGEVGGGVNAWLFPEVYIRQRWNNPGPRSPQPTRPCPRWL